MADDADLQHDREVCEKAIAEAQGGDPGAPLTEAALASFAAVHEANFPEFVRLRVRLTGKAPLRDFNRAIKDIVADMRDQRQPHDLVVAKISDTPSDTAATLQPPALAQADDILSQATAAVSASGLVGEERLVKLLYLTVTSRLLVRPGSMVVKGTSSSGKSYVVDSVLDLFPPSAYYKLSAMSDHALVYHDEPLVNRVLVIYEAAGMASDITSYLIRSLLSEGEIRYWTVEKVDGQLSGRLIHRPGPTGLVITTTAAALHHENETRLLSVTTTDTQAQTAAILASMAHEQRRAIDLTAWHEMQEWLASAGCHQVVIPFAPALVRLIPPVAVRLRRDVRQLLTLVRAHAILHQLTRTRNADGSIVATVADYAAVRELVADIVAEGVGATVSKTVSDTVMAVKAIRAEKGDQVNITVAAVGRELDIDKSAAHRRVQVCLKAGYLVNSQPQTGRPARLDVGDPLPAGRELLPTADEVSGCMVAEDSEGIPEESPSDYDAEWEVVA